MSVKSCSLNIDVHRHETDNRGTPMFPCGGYITSVGDHVTQDIPWHWHEEVEVLVVCDGILKLELVGQCYCIRQGEGAFINSSVLQSAAKIGDDNCTIKSFVFHPSIIAGMIESAFEQRYVRPLLHCTKLPGIYFEKGVQWHREVVQNILDAFEDYQSEPFGYEFLVREKLSRIWLLIVSNHQEVLSKQRVANDMDSLRLKDMLTFIHTNYIDQLELHDIANAVTISERECLRCFKRTIGISPIQYLLRYRISVAADMLANSSMNITEICNQIGFESPSYFSLMFKKLINMTPKEYRNLTKLHGRTNKKNMDMEIVWNRSEK